MSESAPIARVDTSPVESEMQAASSDERKKCTSCTRNPQPLDQFLDSKGNATRRCLKCREKDAKTKKQPEQRERRNAKARQNMAWKDYRDRKKADDPEAFRLHTNEVQQAYRKRVRREAVAIATADASTSTE